MSSRVMLINHMTQNLFFILLMCSVTFASDTLKIDSVCCTPHPYQATLVSVCNEFDVNGDIEKVSLYQVNQSLNIQKKLDLRLSSTYVSRTVVVGDTMLIFGESKSGCIESYQYSLKNYQQLSYDQYCAETKLFFPYEGFKQIAILMNQMIVFPVYADANSSKTVQTLVFHDGKLKKSFDLKDYHDYQPIQFQTNKNRAVLLLRSQKQPANSVLFLYEIDSNQTLKVSKIYEESESVVMHIMLDAKKIYIAGKVDDLATPACLKAIDYSGKEISSNMYQTGSFFPAYVYAESEDNIAVYGVNTGEDFLWDLSKIGLSSKDKLEELRHYEVNAAEYPFLVANDKNFAFLLRNQQPLFVFFDRNGKIVNSLLTPKDMNYIVYPSLIDFSGTCLVHYHINENKRIMSVFQKVNR